MLQLVKNVNILAQNMQHMAFPVTCLVEQVEALSGGNTIHVL